MMAPKYRAAIIGCGRIAGGYQSNAESDSVLTHAKAYAVHEDTEVIAAVDSDEFTLRKFCDDWNIANGYNDTEEMLKKEKPDIVSICTPASAHQEILRLCVDCNDVDAIWCEKPIGKEYEVVSELFKRRKKIFYVNHPRRWDRAIQGIKNMIHGRELGRLLTLTCNCSKGYYESGTHIIDLIYYLLGMPERLRVISAKEESGADSPLVVDVYMEFQNGEKVYLIFSEAKYNVCEFDLLFANGRIRSHDNGFGHKIFPIVESSRYPGHRWPSSDGRDISSDLDRSMFKILCHMVDDLNSGAESSENLEYELKSFNLFCDILEKTKEFIRCQN